MEENEEKRYEVVFGDNTDTSEQSELLEEVLEKILGRKKDYPVIFMADSLDVGTLAAVRAHDTGEDVDRVMERVIDNAWDEYEISIDKDTTIGEILRMVAISKE